jgi:catechol 2,3-dioxygenase-like lactoylglutathione lyase family enzyme
MKQYTGDKIYKRRAILSLNMQGGGGFELWQFLNRTPTEPIFPPQYGDLGIYAAKIKCADISKAYKMFCEEKNLTLSPLQTDEKSDEHFYVKDLNENVFDIVTGNHWFKKSKKLVGGVSGAVIGVSNMESSINFYKTILNISDLVYDKTVLSINPFDNKNQLYRKVLLQKHPAGKGAFGKLLGSVEIELVQCLDSKRSKIYENRFWGDCGFIHLCFDVFDMCGLKKYAEQKGFAFKVDSIDSFGMENASGRFCYMEDPDGTLIELVETHKVPVLKNLGIYFNLKKRNLEKPLPDWMINLLSLSKVK